MRRPAGRPQHLLDVIAAAVAGPELHPHAVHQDSALEDLDEVTVDTPVDASDPRKKGTKVKGRRYVGLLDCPDCGRGLVSRGNDLVCVRLSRNVRERGCHLGCVVACGAGTEDQA